jgi:hypothetical protein
MNSPPPPATRYEGHVFMQRVSGTGPYFGHYAIGPEGSAAAELAWVDLPKPWPTRQLASDDAACAARFAIDVGNHGQASRLAVLMAARVMLLDSKADGWAQAVQDQLAAATERDRLEARLLGARELHWPEVLLRDGEVQLLRSR